jgi:hypothetical protein
MRTIEEFMARVNKTETCWIWEGARITTGYGHVHWGYRGKHKYAHRIAYEHFVGPIPVGMHLDHLCGVKACVNPSHLEVVTQAENNARTWLRRSTCARGHPLDGTRPTGRYCKTCAREAGRRRIERIKSGASA